VGGQCQASAPNCTDADFDGYGAGPGCACAGLDCDDADDTVFDTAQASCYSGPAGTEGVGTCLAGQASCTAGVWGPCIGEVTPTGEACNGQDDDCNGTADDGLGTFTCGIGECVNTVVACSMGKLGLCTPKPPPSPGFDGATCNGKDDDCDGAIDENCGQCIPVAPNGNDATANGSFANPFATIQAAIAFAAANAGSKNVCVAGGNGCSQFGVYAQNVTMVDGVSVLGSYEASNWTRCGGITTAIQPQTAAGVLFPSTIAKVTVLDGFLIDRLQAQTTAAVTVDGGKNAILSGIRIQNNVSVTNSYGVNVINGGEATMTRSRIDAGTGTSESIGVRSVGAKIHLLNNCASVNAFGRCDDFCGGNNSIRGRTQQGTGTSYALLLSDSPGSTVETSALCANDADVGAAIRVSGDAAGLLVRGNLVNAFGGAQHSHGIWMEDCKAAKPWIVDNHYVAAAGDSQQTAVDAVRAIGDCHPVIDGNVQITGGGEGQASNPNGVHCGPNAQAVPSQCAVLGNQLIEGSEFGFPPIATGVRCDGGSCVRVAGNVITGRGGGVSYGVWLEATGAVVDDNDIAGGCSPIATGVRAVNAWSRLQNNRIFGITPSNCTGGLALFQASVGLHASLAAGQNELDVHSNDIDGAGFPNMGCTSRGIELDAGSVPPTGGSGVYRNNIVRAGVCGGGRENVRESIASADPRIFEHNDLDPFAMPGALYVDEATTAITTAAGVDALMDMTVSGTLSVDAQYVNYPSDLHLTAASMCIGKGTPAGAPAFDMDGQPRDPVTPDIGADEF
jgi:hypothetical protein